jgi:hypothetical protein
MAQKIEKEKKGFFSKSAGAICVGGKKKPLRHLLRGRRAGSRRRERADGLSREGEPWTEIESYLKAELYNQYGVVVP